MDVKSPQGFLDKVQDVADAGGDGQVFSEDSVRPAVQGSHQAGRFLAARFSHPAMLAERCRPIHHVALRDHAGSEDREAQRRHVSHAGLRRQDYRHALAAPKSRGGALSRTPAPAATSREAGPAACPRSGRHHGAHLQEARCWRRRDRPAGKNGSCGGDRY